MRRLKTGVYKVVNEGFQPTKQRSYRQLNQVGLVLIFVSIIIYGCKCHNSPLTESDIKDFVLNFQLDRKQAAIHLTELTRAAHPFGSARQHAVAKYIKDQAQTFHPQTYLQEFTATTPNPAALNSTAPVVLTQSRSGQNIMSLIDGADQNPNCLIIIGSHYDTKIVEGIDYVGANDSGSSSVLLLDLLRFLSTTTKIRQKLTCGFLFIWFDGEESVLPEWSDGETKFPEKIIDHTYGSRHFAEQLQPCSFGNAKIHCYSNHTQNIPIIAVILIDMVGSENLKLSYDLNSSQILLTLRQKWAKILGITQFLSKDPQRIEDDHIPFIKKNLMAINIIDFVNIGHWHKASDKIEYISYDSIEKAAKLVLAMAMEMATNPQDFSKSSDSK